MSAAGIVGLAGCSGGDSGSEPTDNATDERTDEDDGGDEAADAGVWLSKDGGARNSSSNTAMAGPASEPSVEGLYEPDGFDDLASVPIVEDGVVYAVAGETLLAVSEEGDIEWEFELGDSATVGATTPAVRDGTVFVPTYSSLVAVADGERQWAVNPGNGPDASPVTTAEAVYLSTGDAVYAYSHDGDERWAESTDESVGRPAVEGSTLYLLSSGFGTNVVTARETSDGSERWSVERPVTDSVPVVADGTLYVAENASEGTAVVALSGDDGDVIWESDPVAGRVSGRPAVADGVVYLSSTEEVHAFDAEDGSAVWDSPYVTTATMDDQVRADSNSVYLHQSGSIVAVDPSDGEQRWSATFDDSSYGGFAGFSVAAGRVYVAGDELFELA
ncbi:MULTISPECIES: PQQ-binding-like beta-propeller repeat protein [Haloarcula]|uniref:outer membrane protein assembly factor BamB family protein n=1 Tax=Haloarcula TaxID=2237 RepID=UPI0023E8F3EA|nr:PQQ-binding-like beta-propeller repeat protein [Halomicroarcula sp. SHR3]